MTREASVEVVRRMYEAFHAGDAEAAMAFFDPEVTVDARVRVDAGVGTGIEELRRVIGQWLAAFDQWQEEIDQMRSVGSRVVVAATQRGRAKGTGIDTETRYGIVYEVLDGRITRMTLHASAADALRAARSE